MKTAFVTGATSGIGRAIALELSQAGHAVIAAGRSAAALDALAADGITPLVLDVTDRQAVRQALSGLSIDLLVNNAGIMPPLANFADAELADMDAAIAVNLSAVVALTRLVVPQMRERGSGHVIFTGSAAGHAAFPNMAVYSATKAGISGFAAALRADLAPHGIRVTEIVPGRVETALYQHILDPETRAAMYASKSVQPEDVARMVRAVVDLPEWADVTRFDIMPTRPATPVSR